MAAARSWWRRHQPAWDPGRLVFIDETALNTKLARLYGRSLRGQRCLGAAPYGHWQTSTFIAALRRDRIDAPFLIEGSANMEVFAAYVGKILCPELHEGDVVILDNLCIHKTPTVARLIEAKGAAIRFLPAYSPDLNPIEWPSPSSSPICARRRPAPSKTCRTRLPPASLSSNPITAKASFVTPAMGLSN